MSAGSLRREVRTRLVRTRARCGEGGVLFFDVAGSVQAGMSIASLRVPPHSKRRAVKESSRLRDAFCSHVFGARHPPVPFFEV